MLPKQTGPSEIFANQAARKMLDLNESSITRELIANLPFYLDTDLISAPDIKRPKESPLLMALDGCPIERRDLTLYNRAISLRSHELELDGIRLNTVLMMERDHRLFVVQRDTSDLLSSEISLRDMIAFDKLMSQLSSQLINAQSDEISGYIDNALAAVGEFCNADRAYIFEFASTGQEFSNTFEWVREGITSHIDELKNIPREALPWFYECIETEGLFLVPDTTLIPAVGKLEQQEFENEDIRSVICVGMYAQQQLIGVVGCDMVARKRHWTEADTRRLKLVGEIIANSLQSERHLRSLHATQQELIEANETLQELAQKDGLTGIFNRRHFDNIIHEEVSRLLRHEHSLTLLLLDIDFFKPFNDYYGHIAGDRALKEVAKLLTEHFRRSGEIVARFGGEEFAVLLPEVSQRDALLRAADFRAALAQIALPHETNEVSNSLTVSIGLSHLQPESIDAVEKLIQTADEALYYAKSVGRDCICYREKDEFSKYLET